MGSLFICGIVKWFIAVTSSISIDSGRPEALVSIESLNEKRKQTGTSAKWRRLRKKGEVNSVVSFWSVRMSKIRVSLRPDSQRAMYWVYGNRRVTTKRDCNQWRAREKGGGREREYVGGMLRGATGRSMPCCLCLSAESILGAWWTTIGSFGREPSLLQYTEWLVAVSSRIWRENGLRTHGQADRQKKQETEKRESVSAYVPVTVNFILRSYLLFFWTTTKKKLGKFSFKSFPKMHQNVYALKAAADS